MVMSRVDVQVAVIHTLTFFQSLPRFVEVMPQLTQKARA